MSGGIETLDRPPLAERAALRQGLAGFNRAAFGRLGRRRRWLLARDAGGALQGGAECALSLGWLHVGTLWVAAPHRGQGLGRRLMAAAEALARAEGCRGVHLNTLSFQAPGFYAKLGFTEVGRLADMPPGQTRHWFAKTF